MVIHVNKAYFSYYNRDGNENIIVVKEIDVNKQSSIFSLYIEYKEKHKSTDIGLEMCYTSYGQ